MLYYQCSNGNCLYIDIYSSTFYWNGYTSTLINFRIKDDTIEFSVKDFFQKDRSIPDEDHKKISNIVKATLEKITEVDRLFNKLGYNTDEKFSFNSENSKSPANTEL